MLFTLKNKDTSLLDFNLDGDIFNGYELKIENIYTRNEDLYPIGLTIDENSILNWIRRRNIPKNREFVNEILKSLFVKPDDLIALLMVGKSLSLNDPFWIVESDFLGKYAEYNLYENDFNAAVALIAYTGHGQNNSIGTIPELTTNGTLRKAWRNRPDGIYLYKGGLHGFSNMGNEPYSEYYAAQVAHTMSINAISYDLEMWAKELASTCKLFTSIDVSFIPIYDCLDRNISIVKCADFFKNISDKAYDDFCNMIVFDALIYNTDRHANNFGVLRNNSDGKILGMAPLFDHGYSIFDENRLKYLENAKALYEYGETLSPAFGGTFEDMTSLFMGDIQRENLKKLIGFKFEKHPLYNLPDSHLKVFEELIQMRVQELLKVHERKQHISQFKQNKPVEKDFSELNSEEKRQAIKEIRFEFQDIAKPSLIERYIGELASCYHYLPNYDGNKLSGVSLIQVKQYPDYVMKQMEHHNLNKTLRDRMTEAKKKSKEQRNKEHVIPKRKNDITR